MVSETRSSSQAGGAQASPQSLEKLVRLPCLTFGRRPLFQDKNREIIHRALGAVTQKGQARRQQTTILKRVTVVFRHTVQNRRLYPSYDLESKTFWSAVLSDVDKEESEMGDHLNIAGLMDIVSEYTTAYANAGRDESSDEEGEHTTANKDEEEIGMLLPRVKAYSDPRKVLLPLIHIWAKLWRAHLSQKAAKLAADKAAAAADKAAAAADKASPASPVPPQEPEEADRDYITRLQATIEGLAAAKEAAENKATVLEDKQAAADLHNRRMESHLYDMIDRMSTRLETLEGEVRLDKIGFQGGENAPWVPFSEYGGRGDKDNDKDKDKDDHQDEYQGRSSGSDGEGGDIFL